MLRLHEIGASLVDGAFTSRCRLCRLGDENRVGVDAVRRLGHIADVDGPAVEPPQPRRDLIHPVFSIAQEAEQLLHADGPGRTFRAAIAVRRSERARRRTGDGLEERGLVLRRRWRQTAGARWHTLDPRGLGHQHVDAPRRDGKGCLLWLQQCDLRGRRAAGRSRPRCRLRRSPPSGSSRLRRAGRTPSPSRPPCGPSRRACRHRRTQPPPWPRSGASGPHGPSSPDGITGRSCGPPSVPVMISFMSTSLSCCLPTRVGPPAEIAKSAGC